MKAPLNWRYLAYMFITRITPLILTLIAIHFLPWQVVVIFDWSALPMTWLVIRVLTQIAWANCSPHPRNMERTMWDDSFLNLNFVIFNLMGIICASQGNWFMAKACWTIAFVGALGGMTAHIVRRLEVTRKIYNWVLPPRMVIMTMKHRAE